MKVLITGGAGYIGAELVEVLGRTQSVSEIVVYDNMVRKNHNLFVNHNNQPKIDFTFIEGDILDTRTLKKAMTGVDVVVHLAAKVTTPFADHNPHEFDQVNHWGTAELSYLVEESTSVKRLLFASSASVYGSTPADPIDSPPVNPRTFYGISKLRAEDHIKRLDSTGRTVYNLRLGNVYGPGRCIRFDSVINKFMFESHYLNKVKIYGSGKQRRSFYEVGRLAQKLAEFVEGHHHSGTYNVVENTWSINEIVDELRNLYPELEMVFVNQNTPMRSMSVASDQTLINPDEITSDQLQSDLTSFKDAMTFPALSV
jgi:UDP-glucose 4-epimerase